MPPVARAGDRPRALDREQPLRSRATAIQPRRHHRATAHAAVLAPPKRCRPRRGRIGGRTSVHHQEWRRAQPGPASGADRAMTDRPMSTVTLLFVDFVESTAFADRYGDDVADDVRRVVFPLLADAVGEARGNVVKTLGDGLMASFASSVDAL